MILNNSFNLLIWDVQALAILIKTCNTLKHPPLQTLLSSHAPTSPQTNASLPQVSPFSLLSVCFLFWVLKVKLPCNMRYSSKSLSHAQSHCLAHLAAVIPSFSRLPWPRRTPNREQSSATRRPIERGETQSIKNWRETDVDEVDFPMLVVPRGCVKKLQCSLKKKKWRRRS